MQALEIAASNSLTVNLHMMMVCFRFLTNTDSSITVGLHVGVCPVVCGVATPLFNCLLSFANA
jgi:hypothetical protein